jgi:hypothetical protein
MLAGLGRQRKTPPTFLGKVPDRTGPMRSPSRARSNGSGAGFGTGPLGTGPGVTGLRPDTVPGTGLRYSSHGPRNRVPGIIPGLPGRGGGVPGTGPWVTGPVAGSPGPVPGGLGRTVPRCFDTGSQRRWGAVRADSRRLFVTWGRAKKLRPGWGNAHENMPFGTRRPRGSTGYCTFVTAAEITALRRNEEEQARSHKTAGDEKEPV